MRNATRPKFVLQPRTGSMLAFAALMLVAVQFVGCNIVGPAAYLIEGPPKTDAVCTLADVPTVIYIDDRNNVVNPVSLRRVIADTAGEALMTHGALATTISPQDAMVMVRQKERTGELLTIEEIGSLVGAKQVIYVKMMGFQDTPDGVTPKPISQFLFKVVDVEHRRRLYPPPDATEDMHGGTASINEVDPSIYSTRSGRVKVFEMLAKQTGTQLAKMFYKHETKELGGSLQKN